MDENVVLLLVDFSSCCKLQSFFANTRKKRFKQVEYLLDLRECSIDDRRTFLENYKLNDDVIGEDVNFLEELIMIDTAVLMYYRELFEIIKKERLIKLIEKSRIESGILYREFNNMDKEECLKALRHNRAILEHIKHRFDWWNDKTALNALLNSKKHFKHFGPNLSILQILKDCRATCYEDNLGFIKEIVEIDPDSFRFASERVKSDKELALRMLELAPYTYTHFVPSLLADRQIQVIMILLQFKEFREFPLNLNTDKEFIVHTLRNWKKSKMVIAESIPISFLQDEDIIEAMKSVGIVQCIDRTKLTRDEILHCVKVNGTNIGFFENYIDDGEILRSALKQNPKAFEYIPEKYLTLEIILEIIEIHPNSLDFIPKKFRKLDCVIEAAILSPNFNSDTLKLLPDQYNNLNEEIIGILLLKSKGDAFYQLSPIQISKLSKSCLNSCLRFQGKIFSDLPLHFQQDSYLLKTAIKHGYVPPRFESTWRI